MEDGLRTITTHVAISQWTRIGEIAARKRQSKADVHRDLVDRGLKDYDREQEHLRQREQVPA